MHTPTENNDHRPSPAPEFRAPLPDRCDVLVVGAGIVGLAHAAAAHDAGLSVVVIDREHRTVGASVRNFGHVCVTGQIHDLADLARTSRARWLALAERAGFEARPTGGLAVARRADELAVLDELAQREPDAVRMLTTGDTRARLGGLGGESIVGGADLVADIRVDPRVAAPRLGDWLATRERVTIVWNTAYLGHGDGVVATTRGDVRADRVLICVGHDLDQILPAVADRHDVQRCGLQMTLLADPGRRIAPAVLTATSMLRYDAFTATDAATALRERMTAERPDLMAADTNVMFTQRPDGSILLGDSHVRAPSLEPFCDETVTDLILDEARDILGVPLPPVRQRWQGVYAAGSNPYLVERIDEDATVVAVTSGVGMTISFGLAARAFSRV